MNGDDEALAIIRGFQWRRWDYDKSEAVSESRSLSDTINELAFLWSGDASAVVLSLLANAELSAIGQIRWRKVQSEEFSKEGIAPIPATRWLGLQQRLTMVDPFKGTYVKFCSLDFGPNSIDKHPLAFWDWQNNWFETNWTQCAPWDKDFFEESFLASDIRIFEPLPDPILMPTVLAKSSTQFDKVNKGGRNPTYDWEKAIAALIFQWADKGDWQPLKQADVVKSLAEWFAEQGATPSDSLLKQRAQWLFREFERRNPDGQ